ncbi:NAD(P)/FAD-dependent oxidoreductase [Guptibacillus algicola]|uniref:NAD(P)/FAD-dependent oxidoreductase n=1 Tax=Guptibacillus algicola TaxID=225844 RepID=UPI001CD1E8A8|nr:NAD(P)/FAD-dependent oxidoreductase [Alkalihalobacillus algicola]MCA0985731.1 NAD(P)/FAD-dependent oxidoreductase [Alkalihalobacillus algicola]
MFLKKDLIIIGGGPAGISAAIWAKRLGLDHVLLESREELGGQLSSINNKIVDYPGVVSENGPSLKKQMVHHAKTLGCEVCTSIPIKDVDLNNKTLQTDTATYTFKSLIIATGSSPKKLKIPGEQEMIDNKEVYSATRDRDRFTGKKVAVIGGGDRAFEGALLLAEAGATVQLMHRSSSFKARKEFRDPVFFHPSIEVLTDTVVTKIQGTNEKQLSYMKKQSTYETCVAGVFIRIGVEPNTAQFINGLECDAEGYLICDKAGKTSLPYVYAAGDVCTRPLLSSISSAAGQGMTAVKSLSLYLENVNES